MTGHLVLCLGTLSVRQAIIQILLFNLRPDGGGLLRAPPPVFPRLPENGGAQRHRFWHTLSYIFSAYVVEILDPGHARSGHQVMSGDLTS